MLSLTQNFLFQNIFIFNFHMSGVDNLGTVLLEDFNQLVSTRKSSEDAFQKLVEYLL